MPRATSPSYKDAYSLRQTVYELVELRGYTQKETAKQLGLSPPRISQILVESLLEFKQRASAHIHNPQEARLRKLEQFRLLRQEAWLAWERSKSDAERTTEERQLKTIFINGTLPSGEVGKIPAGQKLQIVKAVKMVEGRLPSNEYLSTIVRCLSEEARLEGLIEDTILKVTNNNSASAAVSVSWEPLINPDTRAVRVPDAVELALAAASAPPVELPPIEKVPGGWSEAEVRELDDEHEVLEEPEHLNGDGV